MFLDVIMDEVVVIRNMYFYKYLTVKNHNTY